MFCTITNTLFAQWRCISRFFILGENIHKFAWNSNFTNELFLSLTQKEIWRNFLYSLWRKQFNYLKPNDLFSSTSMWCIRCVVLIQQLLERNSVLIYRRDQTSISTTAHAFGKHKLISLSVDEMVLSRYRNLSTNFRVDMSCSWLKHMYSVWSAFTWRPMHLTACYRLCSRDSAWVGIFARSTISSA